MAKEVTNNSRQRRGNNNIRTEQERADDYLAICKFRKQGWDWRRIGRELNAKNGIDIDFVVYYRQYKNAVSNIEYEARAEKDELIADELAGIDWQISELVKAWENSIGTKRKTADNDKSGLTVTEWEENGDPRYMAEITKLRERRAKILGIDAPEKKDITSNGETVKISLDLTKG